MEICVYGSSSSGIARVFFEKTEEFGRMMAERGHSLVFGGGTRGVMGAAARGVKDAGGYVTGLAPSFFPTQGVLFERCDRMIRPGTMRERKRMMAALSDAFAVLPGGIGTYDEFYEILTLKQLGQHNKPIALYNIAGYFDDTLAVIERAINEGFMKTICRSLFFISEDAAEVLDYIEGYDEAAPDMRLTKGLG